MVTTRLRALGAAAFLSAVASAAVACGLILGNDKDYELGTGGGPTSTSSSSGGSNASSSSGSSSSSGASSSTSSSGSTDGGLDGMVATCDAGLDADDKNCGACGHDCLGDVCTAGMCGRTALLSGLSTPRRVVVDANNAYVTEYGPAARVLAVPIGGGALQVLATASPGRPYAMALDATHVYWSNAAPSPSQVWSVPIAGGTPVALFGNSAYMYSWGIALYAGNLYFTDTAKGLSEIAADGGAITPLAPGQAAYGVAVDASYVYWTVLNEGSVYRQLHGAPGSQVQVAAGAPTSSPTDLVLDNGTVYWIRSTLPGQVMSAPANPGSPLVSTVVADNQNFPTGLAVIDGFVYWTNAGTGTMHQNNDGTVMRALVSGGEPLVLAQGLDYPAGIAVDAKYVYWVDYGDGKLWRVAR